MRGSMSNQRLQRGQAMILMAMSFIGLAAFIGLAVDTGILFIQVGHLRRAVDAASLAAANQFREGRTLEQIEDSADEFINLNSLNPAIAEVFICHLGSPGTVYDDPDLCPGGTNPPPPGTTPRKFVRVEATMPVKFAFLPIIGWGSIDIHADAISETASVDIVLVIDTSPSMAYDAPLGDPMREPVNCNPDQCHPFEEVRTAALALVDRMYFPYDRMSIITFDRRASNPPVLSLSSPDSQDRTAIKAAIEDLQVALSIDPASDPECDGYPPDPRGCTSTNTADGLKIAASDLGVDPRQEAVWIVILLTDGSANAALDDLNQWVCPGGPTDIDPTWARPFCRDAEFEDGLGLAGLDAEDAAVEWGMVVGCPEANSMPDPPDPLITTCTEAGQGAVVFTIGLGDLVINNWDCNPTAYPGGCEVNQGEELLRYIAGIGDDGNPDTPPASDPCDLAGIGESCGNYYFSPTGAGLLEVFEAIASRIFTRITH